MIPLAVLGGARHETPPDGFTRIGTFSSATGSSTGVTFPSVELGSPSKYRNILAIISVGTLRAPTSVTIGGVRATLVSSVGSKTPGIAVALAHVPEGHDASVVVTWSYYNVTPDCDCVIYSSADHYEPGVYSGQTVYGYTATATVDTGAEGSAFAVLAKNPANPPICTWDGEVSTDLETTRLIISKIEPTDGNVLTVAATLSVSGGSGLPYTLSPVLKWMGNPQTLTPQSQLWSVSGDTLGAVLDPIPSWGNFAQSDALKQPVVAQDGGVKYAQFDGTKYLDHGPTRYSLNSDQTMFAVVRVPTVAARTVIGASTGTGVALGFTPSLQARLYAHGGDWATTNTVDSASTGEWCIISGRYVRGTSFEARLNNGATSFTPTTTLSTPDRRNVLGGNSGTAHAAMDIAEALNFNRALTGGEWLSVVNFLMNKYGIS